MAIFRANHAGFCFGVKRAIGLAVDRDNKAPIYAVGPLIHNSREMQRLKEHGVVQVQALTEVPVGGTVLVRSHGVGPDFLRQAAARSLTVVDATCPFVKKNQEFATKLSHEGKQVIIFGDKEHPEVQAILAWTEGTAWVIKNSDEVIDLPLTEKPVVFMSQTTQQKQEFLTVAAAIKGKYPDGKVEDTICAATNLRQQGVRDLSRQVSLILVVGGKDSANTKNLARIAEEMGVVTYLIESAAEIISDMVKGHTQVGIAAGASTPLWIIEEIEEVLLKMLDMENQVEGTQADCELGADPYGEGLKEVHRGSRVKGVVVQVSDSEVLVDIGGKSEGVLPYTEISDSEASDIRKHFAVGDEIEVLVIRKENKEGYPVLSKKRIDQELYWTKLAEMKEKDEVVTGKIVEVVKGGVLADVGVRGFIPASLVDIGFVEDLSAYKGKEITAKILECERKNNKLLLSPKAVLLEQAEKQKAATWASLEEGQTRKGIVRRLTSFGAFVEIDGVDGLLHVSEMAWHRVNKPSDILKEGDEVEVYILAVDKEKQKLSLGLKQLVVNPWTVAKEKYVEGSVWDALVLRTAPFGAFLQLEPGVEGLVHISQISWSRVEKTEDVLKPGDQVKVKILSVDEENRRISLSIKETTERPAAPVKQEAETVAEETPAEEQIPTENVEELGVTIGDAISENE
ncbi:MAG: bifunctional 4-hydroxy-3-methylbut-2-enyl diphosphate reductase/30S ribosomal protein S1 [Peptococcaceae bacterium]|nr:bifunctional 4-hydroxy-3-methylbut-2-enyl diphosphate reductase/30S ribosomal protein S1 [Peptococcaceae bacterium]